MPFYSDRLAPAKHRAYTYTVTIPPAIYPVSLDLAKSYLNIRLADTSKDELIQIFIETATLYAESITRRDFIDRTYQTFRDFFPEGAQLYIDQYFSGENYYNLGWLIRRSPLDSVSSVSYLVEGVPTLIDSSVYYVTQEKDYSSVILQNGQQWPVDKDRTMQSIIIEFVAGFGSTQDDVPTDIKNAILQIISALYNNRGDCSETGACDCSTLAPVGAKSILQKNRIRTL